MASFKVDDASEYLSITRWFIGVKLAKKSWAWVWMKMFLFTLLFGSLSLSAQGKVLVIKPSITEKNTYYE